MPEHIRSASTQREQSRKFGGFSFVAISCLTVLAFTAVFAAQSANAETLGSWSSTTNYPTTISNQSCAIYSGYIYCVGGDTGITTSAVYYATVSSSGVGAWTPLAAGYPTSIAEQSCAIYSGYIYCVGGYTGSTYTSAVYYATVSSSGVGAWTSTTSYPTNIAEQSCATSSGYIYCVGGYFNAVYYTPISSPVSMNVPEFPTQAIMVAAAGLMVLALAKRGRLLKP